MDALLLTSLYAGYSCSGVCRGTFFCRDNYMYLNHVDLAVQY